MYMCSPKSIVSDILIIYGMLQLMEGVIDNFNVHILTNVMLLLRDDL